MIKEELLLVRTSTVRQYVQYNCISVIYKYSYCTRTDGIVLEYKYSYLERSTGRALVLLYEYSTCTCIINYYTQYVESSVQYKYGNTVIQKGILYCR